jgi:hypothetical protein
MTAARLLVDVGLDAVALKPTEVPLDRARVCGVGSVTIDYEGREHLPDFEMLETLAGEMEVKLATPVRADGFDPLGDDSLAKRLSANVGQVLVAGHPAYLSVEERQRAVAPRLRAARERAPNAWVGTEAIERIALAAGGTQFELLSSTTEREARALRAAGFTGDLAVYAPVVLTENEDTILDALGEYVARRGSVAQALADDDATHSTPSTKVTDGTAVDSTAVGHDREVLMEACRNFALVGSPERVTKRTAELRDAGIDMIVGYVADGIEDTANDPA